MSEGDQVMFMRPPRLLLGVAFLFWGAMHGQALAALAAAVLVEGRYWMRLRWSFGEKGFARSWQLSVLILVVSVFGMLQEEAGTRDFLALLSWLPFMMLPLGLAQQYCSDRGVPLTSFSFIARRKMAADRKAGRVVRLSEVNLGYFYFFLILIGAGVGSGDVLRMGSEVGWYGLGLTLLIGWGLFRAGAGKWVERVKAWGVAYFTAMLLALVMMGGVVWGYERFVKHLIRPGEVAGSPFETLTSIGEVHRLQLSPRVLWRYYHERGEVPELMRLSSYNWPEGDLWRARMRRNLHRERIREGREMGGDFEKFLEVEDEVFFFREGDEGVGDFKVEGEVMGMVSEQSLLPHPQFTRAVTQVQAEALSTNSMGAIQLNGPRQAAMRVRFFADEGLGAMEHDPSLMDLLCPSKEEEGLDNFLGDLGLEAVSWAPNMRTGRGMEKGGRLEPQDVSEEDAEEVRRLLERFFGESFRYSLFLTGADPVAPMSEFVNVKRVGHCEYFAGATTLLLRRMGIPSRYVVGFAVRETGNEAGEYLLRGRHAHAWSQAYVGGTWVDERKVGAARPVWRCRGGRWVTVDLTPSSWLSGDGRSAWYQFIFDWFQKVKTNLVLWFAGAVVLVGFKVLLLLFVFFVLIYLIYQGLWMRGKRGAGGGRGTRISEVGRLGCMREFERWLGRRVGRRPRSMPMGVWLRMHLPAGSERMVERYEWATFQGAAVVDEGDLEEEIEQVKLRWKGAQKNPVVFCDDGVFEKRRGKD